METLTAMLDSLRPADSARSAETAQHRRPTSKDILAGGYNCQREIPEPVECEFCGRKLYHEALVMGRTVLMFAPFPQRCTCDRAKAKWAEADAEEARQKAEAEKEAAQAKRRAKIERLLGRSGIKKRFQQRTFVNFIRDTPERRRCYDTAKTYADSFPQRAERGEGLYIEGTYGTGKTHLAAAIALQLIGCGVPVVCKTSGDLLADIKEAFDSGDATEYEILKAYKTVDLLIVDDLGKEQCTEWSVSTLYSILNDRYEDMKPTIITTNYNADELVRALTPKGGDGTKARAIISRLREVSTVITCFLHDLMLGNKLLSFILCICDQCICLCLCILKDGILIADDLLITFDLVWSLKPKFTKKLFDFFFIHYNLSCRKWLIFTTVYIFFDFFNDLFNSAAHSKLSLFYFFKSCIFFLTASVISGGANLLRSPS